MDFPSRLPPADIQKIVRSTPASRMHHVLYTLHNNFSEASEPVPRRDITCFRCGETGHKKGECRTWKTKRCTNPVCHNALQCAFAHQGEELRTPWYPKCVRVVREMGQMQIIGCREFGHTFKECPYRR